MKGKWEGTWEGKWEGKWDERKGKPEEHQKDMKEKGKEGN